MRQLMRKLARQGELFQVVHDLFYHPEMIRELASIAAAEAQKNAGTVAAAPFRDVTGLGRKRAIQVLEFFDRVGYTRFHRGLHLLRTDSRWLDLLSDRQRVVQSPKEGIRVRWCGWASNPVEGVRRSQVGSTPAAFRHKGFQQSGVCVYRVHQLMSFTTRIGWFCTVPNFRQGLFLGILITRNAR